ncbi:MAG: sensor histidine kinase [Thermoanaerobaculia bacterium]
MVVAAPFPPSTNNRAKARAQLLATLSRKTLLDTLSAVDVGSGSRAQVVDAAGKIISGDPALEPGDIFVREKLGDGLPDWTVTLFPNASELEHFVRRTRNLYVVLTGLLIAVLLLGAFFIARTVHHEMEVIRIKSDFVSLVSHEFKTPIASMRALMDRLQAGHVSDPQRRQRYYDIISGELQRVTRLVNNVLDFSRMEEGRKEYSREETDLPQLVRDLLSTFEAGASAKGFTIETDIRSDLAKVRVDRDAISQALLNLLDNAVKYSQGEKWIRVAVERNSHALRISVADRGSGIPPDEVAAIFSKFYRGRDTRSRPVPGLGLGLSLVEHVMAGHGGRVTVESPPGSGSVFTLSIPLPETPTPEA